MERPFLVREVPRTSEDSDEIKNENQHVKAAFCRSPLVCDYLA
jgi:hypothetical protein